MPLILKIFAYFSLKFSFIISKNEFTNYRLYKYQLKKLKTLKNNLTYMIWYPYKSNIHYELEKLTREKSIKKNIFPLEYCVKTQNLRYLKNTPTSANPKISL